MSRCLWRTGDVFTEMAKIPDNSVDLIVTSPPFLALRSYLPADHPQKHLEIGSEATPAAFLSTLLALTREWRRILAPHGSVAVELGDTYSGSGGGGGDYLEGGLREGQPGFGGSAERQREGNAAHWRQKNQNPAAWPLPKSLCLLPSLYPASLAYGRNLLDPDDTIEPWRVRNLIVWHRPNPPVGALGDKVRPSTSYITTACVSGSRWFDLDAERQALKYPEAATPEGARMNRAVVNHAHDTRPLGSGGASTTHGMMSNAAGAPPLDCWIDGDVWTIPTAPYKGAHYATYPPALPRRLIRLMCPQSVCVVCGEPRRRIVETTQLDTGRTTNGAKPRDRAESFAGTTYATRTETSVETLGWSACGCAIGKYDPDNQYRRGHVLDPFAGSGTTLIAAAEQGRDATGIDLDPRNLDLARERIGLFLEEPV